MPGDFGSYQPGWFWVQVEVSALDLASGRDILTRKWGQFFQAFAPVAKAVCWSEAGDSSPDHAMLETIKQLPEIKKRLADIENFVRPYREVAKVSERPGEGAT
jgi:hypothetical protein